MTKKQIIILMSTYNGETYLQEQLESIYQQTYQNFKLYVRDDGSQDSTREILNSYQQKYENFEWISGENLGVTKSFFALMRAVYQKNVIYVFSDQDDVWLPHKLETIATYFKEDDNAFPMLYCGDTILVDQKLHILKEENFGKRIKPSFGNALVENICIGCTAAMNENLLSKLLEREPQHIVMHDWWFYLTAACFGEVIYDSKPLVYYRQHKDNVMGSGVTKYSNLVRRLKNHKKHKNQISRQTKEFAESYDVQGENAELLACITSYKTDFKAYWTLLISQRIRRQKTLDQCIFKLLFMFKQL